MADVTECEQANELGAINSTLRYLAQNALLHQYSFTSTRMKLSCRCARLIPF